MIDITTEQEILKRIKDCRDSCDVIDGKKRIADHVRSKLDTDDPLGIFRGIFSEETT